MRGDFDQRFDAVEPAVRCRRDRADEAGRFMSDSKPGQGVRLPDPSRSTRHRRVIGLAFRSSEASSSRSTGQRRDPTLIEPPIILVATGCDLRLEATLPRLSPRPPARCRRHPRRRARHAHGRRRQAAGRGRRQADAGARHRAACARRSIGSSSTPMAIRPASPPMACRWCGYDRRLCRPARRNPGRHALDEANLPAGALHRQRGGGHAVLSCRSRRSAFAKAAASDEDRSRSPPPRPARIRSSRSGRWRSPMNWRLPPAAKAARSCLRRPHLRLNVPFDDIACRAARRSIRSSTSTRRRKRRAPKRSRRARGRFGDEPGLRRHRLEEFGQDDTADAAGHRVHPPRLRRLDREACAPRFRHRQAGDRFLPPPRGRRA